VLQVLRELPADALRKYPDPGSVKLREACAERYGFDGPAWVAVGNGMDELLALALRSFVDPGDRVVSVYPTYTLYETLALLHGAAIKLYDLEEDYALPPEAFQAGGRLLFLPRPNSPTGVCHPRDQVERLCESFPGLVVIDEAYADFAEDDCLDFPKRFENAIVMRTFSKSFSLAGLRLGAAFAPPRLIRSFLKTKDSYNLNAVTQRLGLAALDEFGAMRKNAERVKTTRARLTARLRELGFTVPESGSNFVLARREGEPRAEVIYRTLKERSIYVRYFKARRLEDCLRITAGTDHETDQLLRALEDILNAK
jgi:histidinol-phosphate aminotransferase